MTDPDAVVGAAVVEPSVAVPSDPLQLRILEILERHFGRMAHLVEIELLARSQREDVAGAIAELARLGLIMEDVRTTPGRFPNESMVFKLTVKGRDALYETRAAGLEKVAVAATS